MPTPARLGPIPLMISEDLAKLCEDLSADDLPECNRQRLDCFLGLFLHRKHRRRFANNGDDGLLIEGKNNDEVEQTKSARIRAIP